VLSTHVISLGHFRFPHTSPAERLAFVVETRPGRAVYGSIDPSAAQQRFIRGIDNHVRLSVSTASMLRMIVETSKKLTSRLTMLPAISSVHR